MKPRNIALKKYIIKLTIASLVVVPVLLLAIPELSFEDVIIIMIIILAVIH